MTKTSAVRSIMRREALYKQAGAKAQLAALLGRAAGATATRGKAIGEAAGAAASAAGRGFMRYLRLLGGGDVGKFRKLQGLAQRIEARNRMLAGNFQSAGWNQRHYDISELANKKWWKLQRAITREQGAVDAARVGTGVAGAGGLAALLGGGKDKTEKQMEVQQ